MTTVWICTCKDCQPNLLFQGIDQEPLACPVCEGTNLTKHQETI